MGPFHTFPEEFKNAALFLRLGLPSTIIRHEVNFQKSFSKRKLFKMPALCFSIGGKYQPLIKFSKTMNRFSRCPSYNWISQRSLHIYRLTILPLQYFPLPTVIPEQWHFPSWHRAFLWQSSSFLHGCKGACKTKKMIIITHYHWWPRTIYMKLK